VTPVEIRGDLWHHKTRSLSYRCFVYVILCLAVLVEHRLVTDRQTDTDTDGHTAVAYRPYRASIASRGKTLGSYDGSWLCSLIDLQYIGLYFVANMSDAKKSTFWSD